VCERERERERDLGSYAINKLSTKDYAVRHQVNMRRISKEKCEVTIKKFIDK